MKSTRRRVVGTAAAIISAVAVPVRAFAQDATPQASPTYGEWSFTDVLGNTITLPEPPKRIAAWINVGVGLWDLGIQPVAIFGWTSSNFPDGDHVAWGNIDVSAIANVGNADGNIEPEALLATEPDIILTMRWDNTDATTLGGIEPDMLETISAIAPVAVAIQVDSTDIELKRIEDLAVSLGADLDAPEIAAARAGYTDKIAEFEMVTAEKSDLAAIFASFDPGEFYVAGPGGVGELKFFALHGLNFANAGSPTASEHWETLSVEQALKYPADLAYVDVYSLVPTIEEIAAHPSYGAMPAIQAGQVGAWDRDSPLTYGGIAIALENILIPLRTAEKVT
jgi:iron complex transport system substrate-binding protein